MWEKDVQGEKNQGGNPQKQGTAERAWQSAMEWLRAHQGRWWFSALLNGIGLLLLLLLMQPLFETNDDTTLYELTAGAKGVYDSHLVFIHILVGKFLTVLYRLAPFLQWYTLLQYAVLFCSFTAISYVLLNRFRTPMAVALFGTLYPFFAYEGFILIQFSKTAGYAASAGILLMFHGLERQGRDWGKGFRAFLPILLGMLLALVGGMYRYKEFLLCAALMSGIGIYALLTLRWERSRACVRTVAAYLGNFLLLFLLYFSLVAGDRLVYSRDGEWGDYIVFNDLRSNLLDYGFPDYEENRETYEKLGISEEDLKLYRACNYADPEVFDQEAVETLTALVEKKELNRGFLREFFGTFPMGFLKLSVFPCFLLICCYWLFFGKRGKGAVLTLLYEAAVLGLAYAYLFYLGRYLVSRTETGLWLAASLTVAWLVDTEKEPFTPRTAAAFSACALVFNLGNWKGEFRSEREDYMVQKDAYQGFLETVGRDTEHLYLAKIGTLTSFLAYDPFETMPFGSSMNICKLGGWEYGNPVNNAVLEHYGIENPYRDLIDNDQVIVADDNVKATTRYLKAHYQEDVEAYEVKSVASRHFYQFRSEPLTVDESGLKAADSAVVCDVALGWEKEELCLSGLSYREGTDSFAQMLYLKVENQEDGSVAYYNVTTCEGGGRTELDQGQYGGMSCRVSLKETGLNEKDYEEGRYRLVLILDTGDGKFAVELKKDRRR